MGRRLSAIFAADMVGYSRLMEADEVGTLARQKIHRRELIDPALAEFHGRLVKEMGDGILVEFPSVVDAVQCAVAIQRAMPEREANVTQDRRIAYRIGINLGDIIVEDDDIYGDGVNIAARLEQLAEPGGICISGTAYDQMRATVEVGYESLGEQRVKNIERPIRAYKVLTATGEAGIVLEQPRRRMGSRHLAALGLVLLLAIGAAGWWWSKPDFEPADPTKFAFALPDTPSIAVLPFDNLSGNSDDDYLGDSLTENIIASLGSLPDLIVIARNSSFAYKGKPTKVQKVAEELGVRYVLEGSVQREGDRIRVVAQLVDALDGKHLWAEKHDQRIDDLFDVQDVISEKIAEELEYRLSFGDLAKRWRKTSVNPEMYRRSRKINEYFQQWNLEGHRKAEAAMHTLEGDFPDHDGPKIWLSYLYWQKALLGIDGDQSDNIGVARRYADQAQALIGDDVARIHTLVANLDLMENECIGALRHADRSLELTPSASNAIAIAGSVKAWCGQADAAVDLLQLAMRLEPQYPLWYPTVLAEALAFLGRDEEAKSVAQAVLDFEGNAAEKVWALNVLTTIAHSGGDLAEARGFANSLLAINPNFTVPQLAIRYRIVGAPFYERVEEALKTAGIPEHPPLKLPDKPSIAVLPFNNMSDDESQQYFVDGMVEDLITDLSKVPGLFVIARNSSFAYRGKSVDVKQVARELGVRHVLEGSVRRSGDRVRINAQLIDGLTNSHVWAERYDGTVEDVFDLQDRITSEIIEALKLEFSTDARALVSAAKTSNPQAYDLFLRGRIERQRLNGEGYSNAIRLLERAVEIDPEFSQAHAELAFAYFDGVFRGLLHDVGLADLQEAFARASDHLDLAFRNPTPLAYITKGYMTGVVQRQYDRSLATARRAIEIDPNFAQGYVHVAGRAALAGDPKEALNMLEIARRLDPQLRAEFHQVMGMTYYIDEQYEAARTALENAVNRNPHDAFALQLLIAVYGHFGEAKSAESTLATFNGLNEGTGPTGLVAASAFLWPFKDMAVAERLYHDFKAAGLPDPKPSLDPLLIQRELTPSEVKHLMAPSTTSGVMVEASGQQIPYTQRIAQDGSSSFSVWGTTWNINWSFDADRVRSERGDLYVYKLSDAGRKKWNRQYVIYEKSFNAYYYFDVVN